jgi:mannose-6-phosphate isomerase-like protein (cupin superfamily)
LEVWARVTFRTSPEGFVSAFVSLPGEGRAIDGAAFSIRVRVPSEAVGGALGVIEMVAAPGAKGPPVLHRHTDIDWHGHVLEGTVAMELDGSVVTLPAGSMVLVPRGTAFRWWNDSATDPVRWVCTYTPGGFERYFTDMADALGSLGRPPTPADIAAAAPALWARHGVEVVR